MENPKQEIPSIITTLTSTTSTTELSDTVTRYFTQDVKFIHPICLANSRAEILGIYQWYRIMSPATKSKVLSVMYDPDLNVLVVEIVQWFRARIRPFAPAPARLITRLTLRKIEGLHYIYCQEDFYHTTDLVALIAPYLVLFVWLILKIASLLSNLSAWLFKKAGITGGGLEGGDIALTGLKEGLGLSRVQLEHPIIPRTQAHSKSQKDYPTSVMAVDGEPPQAITRTKAGTLVSE
ncbi:hypothetical protein HYDPIDRAFT_169121 [Hydnomerulius pinastri MD-312]|uniref:SigF-like NTF2-like domain-containing protein n=1 Tax=Hydnomerulius pinastri MD-312 TaxID=994086 RepID=A0A0C9VWB7_9AGAM|nr:hypothetical protein HYDPIDRAFT_169121 [Hydnomerulius pinastri MD-312]